MNGNKGFGNSVRVSVPGGIGFTAAGSEAVVMVAIAAVTFTANNLLPKLWRWKFGKKNEEVESKGS